MIAIAGPNLPIDLLTATNRFAGAVSFDPDRATPLADDWLESKFAPWSRAVLEAWAQGEYDGLQQVLFSRADDSSQRLYYYICELQRRGQLGGPEPLILDVCKIPRAASRARMIAKLRELADLLEVDVNALQNAIAATNDARRMAAPDAGAPICLLAGTPPPDRRLHTEIESCGFVPVGRTLQEEWLDPGPRIDPEDPDPIAAIADRLHAGGQGPRSFADPTKALTEALAASGARVAILWRIEEDEAQCWQLPAERGALESAGIPALVLTRRDWLARDGAREEIAAFLRKANS